MRKAQKSRLRNLLNCSDRFMTKSEERLRIKTSVVQRIYWCSAREGRVQMGKLIENTEGENAATIPILEDYCECVYRVYQEIKQGTADADKSYKRLRKAHMQIENSFRNDIKVRREAVFLPYKASMWDSLESVWKAADDDPDCDAYVIPIPYFDRNSDGSFGEMHYEGNQYPEYVPVTSYEKFDFGVHRPDMVFIHTPYDDHNFVTSIHPFFYSENLKKYTERLIYIPYFILDERDLEDDAGIESMKHYCLTPAVLHADRVIVQSENMRKVYIKVLTEAFGKTAGLAGKKILGIGSPKMDKALNTKKEDLEIPREWMKVIQKPDGSWKKIIFYNTSLGALLSADEKMLRKIKRVLSVFKENQDEAALLWRPHPLIKATISSMRPHLLKEYEKIVEEYREEGWGIYDDSTDMDRAVVLSDAYYGDQSSVARIYKETGKPVMFQNVDILWQ